jgi:hypothetical protein
VGHHVKKDLPDDLTAAGTLDGTFAVQTSHAGNRALQWTGNGQTEEFVLRSSLLKTDLSFGAVPFSLDSLDFEPRIKVGPSRLQLGRSSYATLQAWATKTGYQIGLQGDAQVQRLLDAGQSVGLPLPHPLAEGIAKINLQVAGAWSDSGGIAWRECAAQYLICQYPPGARRD